MTIDDPAFDSRVTLRDAYRIMEHFVAAHLARGEVETGDFYGYFSLATDRRPLDPAALDDYLESVRAVLGRGEVDGGAAASADAPAA